MDWARSRRAGLALESEFTHGKVSVQSISIRIRMSTRILISGLGRQESAGFCGAHALPRGGGVGVRWVCDDWRRFALALSDARPDADTHTHTYS